ncbi:hypothetical protein M0654_00005 [Rhizobium sp. NTR19]|uniref:Uncharacterized protein n=1 Tax=Neorhizobium turbinariae TaxID=2937795 RepID=A0ABT0IKF4_9HYPH|nr:hypothetical protein [Neorhizobium turbinariae]MCK8778352.1 hypothetical protein [Neorhizobium turbinariae]
MAPTEEFITEAELKCVELCGQMSVSAGVELMWDLIAVSGDELADPALRNGMYFDEFKQDAIDGVLRVALKHPDHPLECWQAAAKILSEIDASLTSIGAPGIGVPTYDGFAAQLQTFAVSEDTVAALRQEIAEISDRDDYFIELSDDECRLLKQCRCVAARRKEIRDRGKPLAC